MASEVGGRAVDTLDEDDGVGGGGNGLVGTGKGDGDSFDEAGRRDGTVVEEARGFDDR